MRHDERGRCAMQHAEVVAKNIIAQPSGEEPTAGYSAAAEPTILLPLGPRGGVGQLPGPDGVAPTPRELVARIKGGDLFTSRFAEQSGTDWAGSSSPALVGSLPAPYVPPAPRS